MPRSRLARRRPFQILHPQGSCFTPNGPGQNLEIEAYIEGPRDALSGMVIDVADLDRMLSQALYPLEQEDWSSTESILSASTSISEKVFRNLHGLLLEQNLSLIKVRVYQDKDLWVDQWA